MITKKNRIERRFLYREILNKIAKHTNEMIIQGLLIDDGLISYELVDEFKELHTIYDDEGLPISQTREKYLYNIIVENEDDF